jgi:hypothetical protein
VIDTIILRDAPYHQLTKMAGPGPLAHLVLKAKLHFSDDRARQGWGALRIWMMRSLLMQAFRLVDGSLSICNAHQVRALTFNGEKADGRGDITMSLTL